MGMEGAFISACAAAIAQKENMLHWAQDKVLLEYARTQEKSLPQPVKCPGCGSHEFRNHHGKQVCSYCRIEATYDQD